MSARAGIVVTGTEVLTGRISDRNGPWLADRLLELGIELAHITITGDRAEDMEAQLRFMADQDVDVVITSGGLGPTADDMTVEVVARFAGRPLVLDEALEERIADILRGLMQRFRHWDFDAVRAANRKQALVPEGAYVINPVGTAPGVVVPGKPDGGGPAGPAARAPGHVGRGGVHAGLPGGHGRPHRLRPGHAAPVRPPGVGDGRDAAGGGGRDRGLRPPRDHDLPAPRRGRGGRRATSRGRARRRTRGWSS